MSLFNAPTYKIDKPIRLIELFAAVKDLNKTLYEKGVRITL